MGPLFGAEIGLGGQEVGEGFGGEVVGDEGGDDLVADLYRDAEDGGVVNPGMAQEDVFDGLGAEVSPSTRSQSPVRPAKWM